MNRLRIVVTALIAVGLSSGVAFADPFTVYNTGVDANHLRLAGNIIDPHYTLVQSPDPAYPGPTAWTVDAANVWSPQTANSNWISNRGDWGNSATGIYTFRTTFDLTGLDPSTQALKVRWSTDNGGQDVLLNGQSLGQTTSDTQFLSGFVSFDITSGFVHGINTLDFIVLNAGDFASPLGLCVELTPSAVPEPASLLLLGTGLAGLVRVARRRRQ